MRNTKNVTGRFAWIALSALLVVALCVTTMGLLPNMRARAEVQADARSASGPEIAAYQGSGNRFYYSGDFTGGGTLYYMLYSNAHGLWQGDEEHARVYAGNGVQVATATSESIRATVLSKTGKLSLRGSVRLQDGAETEDTCRVGIALVKNADVSQTTWLLPMQTLTGADSAIDLSGIESADVAVNDVLLYVAGKGDNTKGVVFDAEIEYKSVTASQVPSKHMTANPVAVEGNLSYDAAGNAMTDAHNVFKTAMATNNAGNESLLYVYQATGTYDLRRMDFAGWAEPGFWYTMPNAFNSVGAVWQNKFYSNPPAFGYSGFLFTAPAAGTLSIGGAYARSSTAEAGDDGASIGQAGEYARWNLYRVSGTTFTELCGDAVPVNSMKGFAEVSGTQNIDVAAGERIFLRYDCSAAWKVACLTPSFQFVATPVDEFGGWEVSGDITEAEYALACSPTQGVHHWYNAYGSINEYYLMEHGDNGYVGSDAFSTVGIDGNVFTASASSAVMKAYKTVGSGTAVFTGNATVNQFLDDGTELAIYKRAYADGGWGEPELLVEESMSNAKMYAEFQENVEVHNGDVLIAVIRYLGEQGDSFMTNVTCNLHVALTVEQEGTEVDGIGESVQTLSSDVYFTEQGKNGWFYAYGTPDNYVLMEYGFGIVNYARWSGPEWNNAVESGKQLPSAYSGALCIYVADRAGTFVAKGAATLLKTDGEEGVTAAVYHNGESVWTHDYAADETDAQMLDLSLDVQKGDVIQFYVINKTGLTVAYATEFSFNFAYALRSTSEDVAAPETLASYLSAKGSYAEYIGIAGNTEKQDPVTIGTGSDDSGNKKCGSELSTDILPIAAVLLLVAGATAVIRVRVNGRKKDE